MQAKLVASVPPGDWIYEIKFELPRPPTSCTGQLGVPTRSSFRVICGMQNALFLIDIE
jgi:hypothetical protein